MSLDVRTGTPCARIRSMPAILAAASVPIVKIIRGDINSMNLLTNGRANSNSLVVGDRPPGVRQKINGDIDTVSRPIPIAYNILSIISPAAPDSIFPDASSSLDGMSVIIIIGPGFCGTCGKTVFDAPARNG